MADDLDDVKLTELEEAFRRSQASMQEVFTRGFDRLEASLLTIIQRIDTMLGARDDLSSFPRSTTSVKKEIDPGTQDCLLFVVEEDKTEELSAFNLSASYSDPKSKIDTTEAVELTEDLCQDVVVQEPGSVLPKSNLHRDVLRQKSGSALLKPNLHRDVLIQTPGSVSQAMKLAKLVTVLLGLSDEPPSSKISTSIRYRTMKRMAPSTSGSGAENLISFLIVTPPICSNMLNSVYLFPSANDLLQVLDSLHFIFIYDPGPHISSHFFFSN
ncbi:hypothetical protein QN277_028514 [Acacia crassicarpa]|uniref:Uncharacterized protein n=1 Tax=Acacia crassicarpa TaxID=499986 RepID=A0AAE1MF79_9FABA|nr:hypothetical protein QN277_028514 [Acacia crassicarpa]